MHRRKKAYSLQLPSMGGLMNSSTRCEMAATLLAMSLEVAVHIGVDDLATVTEGSNMTTGKLLL